MKNNYSMKEMLHLLISGVPIESIAGRMKTSIPNATSRVLLTSIKRIKEMQRSMGSQSKKLKELTIENDSLKIKIDNQKKEIEQLQTLRQSINSLTSERSKLLRKIKRLGGK